MEFFLMLMASVAVILIIAVIDVTIIRRLSVLSRVGLFTYLIGLVLLGIGAVMLSELSIDPDTVLLLDGAGVICEGITLVAITVGVDNKIDSTNLGRTGSNFWKAICNMIIFGMSASFLQVMTLEETVQLFSVAVLSIVSVFFMIMAVFTVIVLLFKILFGQDEVQ